VEEIIRVKGQSVHSEQVISTHHGPIISSVVPSNGKSISLSSVALEPGATFEGFALIGQAQNWQEFKKAVRAIRAPSLNLIYADNQGNIGYYVSGRVPIRAGNQGSLPRVGWSGEQEWKDEIPFEEMPHAFNPKRGFIISANNKIVDDKYPYYLGSSWRNGYRAARIEQLIKGKDLFSPKDCMQMHMDCLSLPGIEFAHRIKDVAVEDEDSAEVRKFLEGWDGQLSSESIGGTVFQVLLKTLSHEILEPALGSALTKEILGEGPHPILAPVNELSGHWTSTLLRLLDDRNLLEKLSGKSYEAVIRDGLSMTAAELKKHLGPDPQKWRWGRFHQISFQHTLGSQRLLDQIFSQGPYPIGGDSDTVLQVAIAPGGEYHDISVSPSYRHVVNLADLDDSMAMYVPGQSGHLGSRHYGDLIKPWLSGEYFPMTNTGEGSDTSDMKSLTLGPSPTSR
jgi:penicillin amidase